MATRRHLGRRLAEERMAARRATTKSAIFDDADVRIKHPIHTLVQVEHLGAVRRHRRRLDERGIRIAHLGSRAAPQQW